MKKEYVVLLSAVIILVCAVACIFVLFSHENKDNNNVAGLSGTYEYTASGTYNNGTLSYQGTWVLSFDNGNVTYNNRGIRDSIPTGSVTTGTSGIHYIPATNYPMPPPVGYVDKAPQKNHMLQGMQFEGLITINIPIYGSMSLHQYLDSDSVHYYTDNNGKIYRMVLERGALSNVSGNVQITFDMK